MVSVVQEPFLSINANYQQQSNVNRQVLRAQGLQMPLVSSELPVILFVRPARLPWPQSSWTMGLATRSHWQNSGPISSSKSRKPVMILRPKAGTKDQQNPEQITALYQTVCTEYLACFYGSGHHDSTPGGRAGDISVVHLDSILCLYPLTWLN